MKRFIVIIALVASGIANATDSNPYDCDSGLTPDRNTAVILPSATVSWVGVRGTKIVARLTSGACIHDVYIEETDKSRLAVLLTAKATGKTVKAYFQADDGSPDYNWAGLIATRYLMAIDLE